MPIYTYDSDNQKDNDQRSFKPDINGNVARNVCDTNAHTILNDILIELGGTAGVSFHGQDQRTTTPGSEQTTISVVVPAGKTRTLSKVVVTSKQRVKFRVLANSVEVGSGRVSSGNPNAEFSWTPGFSVAATLTIEVKILQDDGPSSDVETYLMATDT
jgi:hypothetical protein